MKKLTFILTLISFTLIAYGQRAQLTVIDPELDASEIEGQYEIHRPQDTSVIPDKGERDVFLAKLTKKISKWDELKKDIFFMELKSKTVSELQDKYPELSEKELKELKGLR